MPDIDRRKFKTPYFKIWIGDSKGQRMVKLPHHYMRLVEKVEIMQTLASHTQEFSTFTIDFLEGSREPASPDKYLGTKGLYQIEHDEGRIDMNVAGSITNRPGAITDARFSGNHGITFITDKEAKEKKISSVLIENVEGKSVSRIHKTENKSPKYLFSPRNQIKIEWGYLEDKRNRKFVRGYINVVKSSFPENGQPRTTISCQSTSAFFAQTKLNKAVEFATVEKAGDGFRVNKTDIETPRLIRELCAKIGIKCVIEGEEYFKTKTEGKDSFKKWPAGESFNDFMNRLAKRHNAYYEAKIDPKTGKDTIYFRAKNSVEKKHVIPSYLLTYKHAGSILKSVEILADFGTPIGTSLLGLDPEDGEITKNTISHPVGVVLFKSKDKKDPQKKEEALSCEVNGDNYVEACKNIVKIYNTSNEVIGTVRYTPETTEATVSDEANNIAEEKSRALGINLTTIGYPQLEPGVVRVNNIGVRFSHEYRLLTVSHVISSSGYTCQAKGVTSYTNDGTKLSGGIDGESEAEHIEKTIFKQG